jgi:PKD repeat protein
VVHADHHSLCFRSSDAKLFEGNDGGVYCTADHGASWTDKSNGIVPGQLYRIGVSATQSDEVISGLQDNGTKLYHAGVWTDRRGGDGMECAIDFTDVNVQYASTPYGAVVRTPDHWSSVIRITQDAYGNPIHGLNETGAWVTPYLLNPSDHQTLFIGLKNVWKSVDQGNNWVKISTLNRDDKIRALAVAPSDDQVIYAACLDSIWKTTNGGTTWTDITGTLTFNGNYITYITVKNDDPSTLWVSLGEYDGNGVYRSTDGGITWENISDGLPEVPVMCVVQNKQNSNNVELYAGTDAGVYFKPGDHKWMPYNTNLPNVVVTELDIYYDNATPANSKIRAATYGRGLWESDLYTPPSVPPAVDFAASDTTPNIGQTVYLYDSCTNTPVAYQWRFNPNTVTFKEGTSATSQNPVVVFNAAGKYTVSLTASNAAGTNTTTKTDYLHVNYCDAGGGGYNYISSVVLGQIHNSGTGSSHYADYTNLSTDLTYPSIYFITVVDSNNNASDDLGVWIDFNKDGDFDDVGEKVACYTGIKTTDSYRIYWPSSEPETGITRMRVRVKYSNNDCGSPCGTTNYGEVEDYTVVVVKESIWQGDSDDWFDPNNWDSKQVPDSFINVFIPQTPSGGNYPKIISGKTARCNTITLETGSTLIVDGTLEVRK